jgi:predicted dehydrogenase/NADPH:quinone reductase-like Zn-dependent oxidoreductase
VPGNLCVRIPEGIGFAEGSFATVGSIALHAVRQSEARLGERAAVIGLGLVGQLAGQLLRAAGCQVIGVDLSQGSIDRARDAGSVDEGFIAGSSPPPAAAEGVDVVLVTAATRSDNPLETAARLCRDRGRVVVVGDVGMQVPRAPFYGKELELRMSRSYGPGRYDREYEERGLDYPIGYVRWTERRNMAAFLDFLATGRIAVGELISKRVPVQEAHRAYDRLVSDDGSPLGIVLTYDESQATDLPVRMTVRPSAGSMDSVSVIGAGSFARRILIPGLVKAGFSLSSVASGAGLSAQAAAERFGFERATEIDDAITDSGAGLVVIATRHASHAALAARALVAGKAVYVEKPPCLTRAEVTQLRAARQESERPIFVGFNRRQAPFARALRDHVTGHGHPVELLYRVSADRLPPGHWLDDPLEGGGRLLGEGCHFIDFACWFMRATPARVACTLGGEPGAPLGAAQRFAVTLEFGDSSVATVLYGTEGAHTLAKEYVEAHAGGRSGVLDDFRSLTLHGNGRRRTRRSRARDKGHDAQFVHMRAILDGRRSDEEVDFLDSMEVTLAALRAAQRGETVDPSGSDFEADEPPAAG